MINLIELKHITFGPLILIYKKENEMVLADFLISHKMAMHLTLKTAIMLIAMGGCICIKR